MVWAKLLTRFVACPPRRTAPRLGRECAAVRNAACTWLLIALSFLRAGFHTLERRVEENSTRCASCVCARQSTTAAQGCLLSFRWASVAFYYRCSCTSTDYINSRATCTPGKKMQSCHWRMVPKKRFSRGCDFQSSDDPEWSLFRTSIRVCGSLIQETRECNLVEPDVSRCY